MVRQTCNEIMGLRSGPSWRLAVAVSPVPCAALQDANLTLQADQACVGAGAVARLGGAGEVS